MQMLLRIRRSQLQLLQRPVRLATRLQFQTIHPVLRLLGVHRLKVLRPHPMWVRELRVRPSVPTSISYLGNLIEATESDYV